jgi:hypothetical protein
METITAIEAVRKAIDPWGMEGQHTTAMRPTAAEVLDRLATLGFVVAPRARVCTSDNPRDHQGDTCPIHEDRFLTESERRVMDGNR